MKITAGNVSVWASIIAAPSAIGFYVTGFQTIVSSVRAGPDSPWPSIFMGLFLIFGVIALVASAVAHWRREREPIPTQGTGTTTSQFRNVEEFHRTYDNKMLTETEGAIKAEVEKYEPNQREKFLVRLLATVITIALFERAWLTIFRSQLSALHDLSVRIRTYDELRQYYEEAVTRHPKVYEKGSFEMWLGFLKLSIFVREYSPTQVEITVRGMEFLKYLLEMHYDESTRIG
jgi:hypothetical protein